LQAASLAQEKEDLAKLGKASGELVELVSKQKAPKVEKPAAATQSGVGSRRDNGAITDFKDKWGKEKEDSRRAQKKPACGCTIL
jgi:hypothetical protein